MLQVYLLRHGETVWNADGNHYNGRTDTTMTERGVAQGESVRKKLQGIHFDHIYSSPLQRAHLTAKAVSGREDVQVVDDLIEVDFGEWEGKSKETFIAEYPGSWEAWMDDPRTTRAGRTGETGAEVVERVDRFFRSLCKQKDLQRVMVVAHNGVNRLYLAHKMGMPLGNYRKFALDNASITIFELDDAGELTLLALNQ